MRDQFLFIYFFKKIDKNPIFKIEVKTLFFIFKNIEAKMHLDL